MLFIIYVANLFQIIERHFLEAQGYADDHQVYLTFRPISSMNKTDSDTAIEIYLAELRSWMISNLLMVCNVSAPTTPLVLEPGLITHSESWASSLTDSAKGSDLLTEKPAGRLDYHIPPFLNGTRHPCLATRHSHQAINMTISRLWINYQCTEFYPGLRTSPQCNVPAPTTPLVFEPGLITHSESRASTLTNSAKGSDLLSWEASRPVGLSQVNDSRRNSWL